MRTEQGVSAGPDLLDLAQRRLEWLSTRQQVLARNVANVNTPGYTPRDSLPFDAALAGFSIPTVRTDPRHLNGDAEGAEQTATVPRERAPDGNAVSLQQQLTDVAENDSQQRLATSLYTKYLGMYATALDKG